MCYMSGVIDSLKQILSTCSGPLLMHLANPNPSSKTPGYESSSELTPPTPSRSYSQGRVGGTSLVGPVANAPCSQCRGPEIDP